MLNSAAYPCIGFDNQMAIAKRDIAHIDALGKPYHDLWANGKFGCGISRIKAKANNTVGIHCQKAGNDKIRVAGTIKTMNITAHGLVVD